MKKEFTQIAMLCNKEQFEAIKPKLEKAGVRNYVCTDFDEYNYLTNPLKSNEIVSNHSLDTMNRVRKIHETWNERIFLESCGIEIEETFEITKEQVLELKNTLHKERVDYLIKQWFPEVFEVKLEVGKWYKRPHNKALFFIVSDPKITPFEVYGLDMEGSWMNVEKARTFPDFEIEATEQEVFEALKNEAVKRGFVDGVYFNSPNNDFKSNIKGFFNYNKLDNCLYNDGIAVFNKGKWAKIIPTKTKEEAEKLLNCKIID